MRGCLFPVWSDGGFSWLEKYSDGVMDFFGFGLCVAIADISRSIYFSFSNSFSASDRGAQSGCFEKRVSFESTSGFP